MEAVDFQTLFNIAIMAAGGLFGWILKTIWEVLRDLQTADKELTDKVNHIEVLVAGKYVTRDELHQEMGEVKAMLDKIFYKLDGKADRSG